MKKELKNSVQYYLAVIGRINNIMKFQDLLAYQKSFDLAMFIFETTKPFPKEEQYSLTSQIRKSSRSIAANISETYRKSVSPKHFLSKLTDSDVESLETQTWLAFHQRCDYIKKLSNKLLNDSEEVGKRINYMITNPLKFGIITEH